jgi:formylglycine-generating enzyme
MKTKRLLPYILIALLITFKVNGQELIAVDTSMVLIPTGSFLMGKDSDKGHDFSPAHKVNVNSFYIDKYEVTNREYLLFCKETGHKLPEFWNSNVFKSGTDFLNYPVVGINWWDAQKYAKWAEKRLPTEAEWECCSGWNN